MNVSLNAVSFRPLLNVSPVNTCASARGAKSSPEHRSSAISLRASPADGFDGPSCSGANARQLLTGEVSPSKSWGRASSHSGALGDLARGIERMLKQSGALDLSGTTLGSIGGSAARPKHDSGGVGKNPAGSSSASRATSGIHVTDPRIKAALEQIARDPDGGKLLQAAKAKGLRSITVNPNLGSSGVTRTVTRGSESESTIEVKNPNSPNLIRTLVHELGHAATPERGSSRAEEQAVDAIGSRVQRRITGRNPTTYLDLDAYRHLRADNGIKGDLRALGIAV